MVLKFPTRQKNFLKWLTVSLFGGLIFLKSSSSAIAGCPSALGFPGKNDAIPGGNHLLNFHTDPALVDQGAPQLSTLVEGNARPAITKAYTINGVNPPGSDVPLPFAPVIGLSASGQNILVPKSGYDIGGGMGVIVLYADGGSITLKYGTEDDIACGYTVHLAGLSVNSDLVSLYNQLNAAGRTQLPTLKGSEIIGRGSGEVLVAIRDTGSLMDPRWENDWWHAGATSGVDFSQKYINVVCNCGEAPPFPWPPIYPPGTFIFCEYENTETRNSRPWGGCANCNKTNYLYPSCAQAFKATKKIEIPWNACPPLTECEGEWFANIQWNGQYEVNPNLTEVPFAGKKKEDADIHEDEIKYLADYFEGTDGYYRDHLTQVTDEITQHQLSFPGVNNLLAIDYQGVLRKLGPYEYQNQLRKKEILGMIDRANLSKEGQIEYGQIHDYNLLYLEHLCWSSPFYVQMIEAIMANWGLLPQEAWKLLNFCLYNNDQSIFDHFVQEAIQFIISQVPGVVVTEEEKAEGKLTDLKDHWPPDPSIENYAQEWQAWRESAPFLGSKGYYWRLWQVAPLVTREDTEGFLYVIPELSHWRGERYEGMQWTNIYVPHLARLWESSRWIQDIMLPYDPDLELTSNLELLAQKESESQTFKTAEANEEAIKPTLSSESKPEKTETQSLVNQAKAAESNPVKISDSCSSANQTPVKKNLLALNQIFSQQVLAETSYSQTYSSGNCLECPKIEILMENPITPPWLDYTIRLCRLCDVSQGIWGDIFIVGDGRCTDNFPGKWNLVDQCWYSGSPGENPGIARPRPISCPGSTQVCASYKCDNCPGCPGVLNCVCCLVQTDENCNVTKNTCGEFIPEPPFPTCFKPYIPESDWCIKPAIEDPNPNDLMCADPTIVGKIFADELVILDKARCDRCAGFVCEIAGVPIPGLQDHECCKKFVKKAYRQIEVKTVLPYLQQAWEQSAVSEQGFFNYFRPEEVAKYPDTPAKDKIIYTFTCDKGCSADPGQGEFYYPFLGGIQIGKEGTIKTLTPQTE